MNSVTKEDAFPSTFSKLLKKMICLKQLDDKPFSQSMTIDIEELSKLDIAADDENTKGTTSPRPLRNKQFNVNNGQSTNCLAPRRFLDLLLRLRKPVHLQV